MLTISETETLLYYIIFLLLMALTTNPKVWKIMGSICIVITLFFSLFFFFKTISLVMLFAGVLIFMTNKISYFFSNLLGKLGLPLFLKKTFTYIIIIGFIYITISGLYGSMISVNELIADNEGEKDMVTTYYERYQSYIPQFNNKALLSVGQVRFVQEYVISFFRNIFSNFTSYFVNSLLIVPLMFYMYYRKRQQIKDKIMEMIPVKFHTASKKAAKKISKEMKDFANAKFWESLIIFVICAVGFFISGLKGWLFLALFEGILNIVPYIGPLLGAVPAIVLSLLTSPVQALFVIITICVAQLVDNFYLIPFMISNKVRVDSLLSIILILIGAKLFGPVGMILAVPIYLIFRIVLQVSYSELIKVYKRYDEYSYRYEHELNK